MAKPTNKMSMADRAKQFSPFAAVRGLDDALARKERESVSRRELSVDESEALDRKFRRAERGATVSITYFDTDEYVRVTGRVAIIDPTFRYVKIADARIPFDDVADIEFEDDNTDE